MRIFPCMLLLIVASVTWGAPIVEKCRGDWILVNGLIVLHIDEDGSMTLRNTGAKGPIAIKDNGDFSWSLPEQPQSGRFTEDKLLLKNDQKIVPKWMEFLEFRRASKDTANEVIESALRQQTQVATAFEKIRRSSVESAIRNNMRQLAAAADQFFLENGVDKVKLEQIVGPDKLIRKLEPIDGEDYSQLDLAQGTSIWKVTTKSDITVTYNR